VELNPYIELGLKAQSDPNLLARLRQAAAVDPNAPGPATAVAAAQNPQQAVANPQAFLDGIRQVVREEVTNTWDQRNFDTRQMERLHKRAGTELDGFEKMAEHPTYVALVNHAIYLQNEGTLEQKGDDPTYSAMDYAHKMFLSTNPGYMKAVKETGKREALDKAERKAEANAAGGTSRSAEGETGGDRKTSPEQKEWLGIIDSRHGGRKRLPSARR
jgi:hypothetical protein